MEWGRWHVGSYIDLNLEQDYVKDRGIKGAFWANFLDARHVEMAGGESHIREELEGLRIEPLGHDGLLIVATDSPLPDDTQETRERFLNLHAALQPAFLSRDESTDFRKLRSRRRQDPAAVQRRTVEDAEDAKNFGLKISACFAPLAVASGDSSPTMPQR